MSDGLLKLVYIYGQGDFTKGMQAFYQPIAKAATIAVTEAGQIALTTGRAAIAAGGLSSKWQNAYRLTVYPKGGTPSVDTAAWLFHKIPYANIFQTGGVVAGKPLLFIPLTGVPATIGRNKMTPDNYTKLIGPLVAVNLPGHRPLLFGSSSVGKTGRPGKPTLKKLGKAGTLVPLFVGIPQINIKKRFDLDATAAAAASRLGALYTNNLDAG